MQAIAEQPALQKYRDDGSESREESSNPSNYKEHYDIVTVHAESNGNNDPTYEEARMPQLPPLHDFSIDGILEAIQPDIQGTIDAIAEILGRSSYSLANQYGAHMPPQGVIRAAARGQPEQILLPVEEASSSNERLADAVVVVGEDTSLIEGSHGGSVAHDLLDRIRAANNARRLRDNERRAAEGDGENNQSPTPKDRVQESPVPQDPLRRSSRASLALLQGTGTRTGGRVTTQFSSPLASPTHFAVGGTTVDTPFIREGGHTLPLYGVAEAGPFENPALFHQHTVTEDAQYRSQTQSLSMIRDVHSLITWLQHSSQAQPRIGSGSAHDSLQRILNQQPEASQTAVNGGQDMYTAD